MRGMDSSASRSLGTPISVNFSAVRESAAAKPICAKKEKYNENLKIMYLVTIYSNYTALTHHNRLPLFIIINKLPCK